MMIKFAIIVAYEPDIHRLNALCYSIIQQDFRVVIVDNSEIKKLNGILETHNCFIISNGKNMGIAYAQNIGVKFAKSKGAEVVTFFDQDSSISDDLLCRLEGSIKKLENCIVCPISVEEKTGIEYPSHRIKKFGFMEDVYSKSSNENVEVDIAISSGMTTYIETFNRIGNYDEDFFIDFVDIEWCLRSRKEGVKIYIVPDAVMCHSIGESSLKIGIITIMRHSPIRTYYKVRNSFLLLRKDIGFLFSVRQIIPAMIHNLILSLIEKERKTYFYYYLKGFFHGVIGKKGKYQ